MNRLDFTAPNIIYTGTYPNFDLKYDYKMGCSCVNKKSIEVNNISEKTQFCESSTNRIMRGAEFELPQEKKERVKLEKLDRILPVFFVKIH